MVYLHSNRAEMLKVVRIKTFSDPQFRLIIICKHLISKIPQMPTDGIYEGNRVIHKLLHRHKCHLTDAREKHSLNLESDALFSWKSTVGGVIGEFNATDPDAYATLSFHWLMKRIDW